LDSTPDLIDLKEIDINKIFKAFDLLVGKETREYIQRTMSSKKVEGIIRSSLPKFINKHGIACFSMLPGVNMSLLSNYANNHKGLYFQYNIELDLDLFKGLKPMNYGKELKKITIELLENEEDIYKLF